MPGIQDFTYLNWGKETVRGTPVAPTRKFYGDGTGVLEEDLQLNLHENENRGVRTPVVRATSQGIDVAIKAATVDGVDFDTMVWPFTQLQGALAGVGGGADKTWTLSPSMTGANNPESFSLDVGDDVQNWRVEYAMMSAWSLSSAQGELTELECTLFGQQAVKGAKATPADTNVPRIVGDLWTIKYAGTAAGLPGAAVQLNHLIDWKLDVKTGLIWRHYQDGTMLGSQHVETSIDGTLAMTVESTALAVSEMYDKWKTQTLDFVRLKNTSDVVLGGSFYSLQLDLPIFWTKVPPISKADEGVNLYGVEARLAYDPTSAKSITGALVCSLAAIP